MQASSSLKTVQNQIKQQLHNSLKRNVVLRKVLSQKISNHQQTENLIHESSEKLIGKQTEILRQFNSNLQRMKNLLINYLHCRNHLLFSNQMISTIFRQKNLSFGQITIKMKDFHKTNKQHWSVDIYFEQQNRASPHLHVIFR